MKANRSIVFRLILVISLWSGLIFIVVLGYNYHHSREVLEKELEKNAANLALSLANKVDAELVSVSKVTEGVAKALETADYDEKSLRLLLRETLEANPGIYGSCAAFEPHEFRKESVAYALYFFRRNGTTDAIRLDRSSGSLPYFYWDWYQIPFELGRKEWSEPYFDEGWGNQLMMTCSVPVFKGGKSAGQVRGIVTSDLSIESLTRLVSSTRILRTGYAALISRQGVILAHPLKQSIMNETFFSIAEERRDPGLRKLGQKMIRGESGFVFYKSLVGVKSWMYYTPIRSTGWTLAVIFPEAELMENITNLTMVMTVIGFLGIAFLCIAVFFISKSITSPLIALAGTSRKIAEGNFELDLPPIRTMDEVGVLTASFQSMVTSLKQYIRNLTETTAAKERIQSELKLAKDIQASLLPRIFPPFPERPEFDIYAMMRPAKEVGGDFYDFFFTDRNSLCFLVADVADKGVPAALYMMVAKTLLKSEGQRVGDPGKILCNVNNILAEDNENCMFATVFVAILDTVTGEVRYANAGHNPPLLVRSGSAAYVDAKHGLVLGPLKDSCFETGSLMLMPGDTIFLYTDGVTEAMNRDGEFFGDASVLETVGKASKTGAASIISSVGEELGRFTDGAEQADDITMLAVIYRGMP
ncbi:MAG: SpoIIE family protein phosphatase [Chlorobiaceae bacterium]|nr:SpoIIE family protein phosphatase [Chlorobiaceae bacterium]NTV61693.1 SpoIIE family protein phosphatase [Chlorobiaceae bacterium]